MQSSSRKVLIVTVGHLRPMFIPDKLSRHLVTCIESASDLAVEPPIIEPFTDRELSEYYWLFGLKNYLLQNINLYSHISVSHYRRFISFGMAGVVSENQSYTRVVDAATASVLAQRCLIPAIEDYMVGSSLSLEGGSIFTQFGRHHSLHPLFRLLSNAGSLKILDNDFMCEFARSRNFIPAPSASFLPVVKFVSLMEMLERCVRSIVRESHVYIDSGYQRRILAFSIERVHAVALARILRSAPELSIKFGQQYVVSDVKKISGTVNEP